MDKELQTLLKEIENFQNEDVDYDLFNKVEDEDKLLPGFKVEIYWIDRENTDDGYLFQLPHQDPETYDLCVHINNVDNSDGIDDAPDEFKHIYTLVQLERIKRIIAYR